MSEEVGPLDRREQDDCCQKYANRRIVIQIYHDLGLLVDDALSALNPLCLKIRTYANHPCGFKKYVITIQEDTTPNAKEPTWQDISLPPSYATAGAIPKDVSSYYRILQNPQTLNLPQGKTCVPGTNREEFWISTNELPSSTVLRVHVDAYCCCRNNDGTDKGRRATTDMFGLMG